MSPINSTATLHPLNSNFYSSIVTDVKNLTYYLLETSIQHSLSLSASFHKKIRPIVLLFFLNLYIHFLQYFKTNLRKKLEICKEP